MSLRSTLPLAVAAVVLGTDSPSTGCTVLVGREGQERACRISKPAVAVGCIAGVDSCTAGALIDIAVVVARMRSGRLNRLGAVLRGEVVACSQDPSQDH